MWRRKKQSDIVKSSAEAKFKTMTHEICEEIWLKMVLDELKVLSRESMKMYCDNQASISIAKNLVHHDKTKHIEIDHHSIRRKLRENLFP